MTRDLVQSREAVRRAARATRLLLALTVAALATLGAIFASLMERQSAMQEGGPEHALYLAHHADRNARLLHNALLDASAAGALTPSAREDITAAHRALQEHIGALVAGGSHQLPHGGRFAQLLSATAGLAESVTASLAEPWPSRSAERAGLARATAQSAALLREAERLVEVTDEQIMAFREKGRDGLNQL